jgi:hypothetical protein
MAETQFPGRCSHTSVVFNNRMWVIGGALAGGEQPSTYTNDVWYSSEVIK